MVRLILLLILSIFMVSCSKSGGSSDNSCDPNAQIVGVWASAHSNQLELRADCTGLESSCGTNFVYERPQNGFVNINISSNNGAPGCLPLGQHTCTFDFKVLAGTEQIFFNCGEVEEVYFRQE